MLNVVLVEPEIPQNTGNISRTCAVTNTALHLIRPLGFEISDRTLRRAGLDYWKDLAISYYDSFEELEAKNPRARFFSQPPIPQEITATLHIWMETFLFLERKPLDWVKNC